MATVQELVADGKLCHHELPDDDERQCHRNLYLGCALRDWLTTNLQDEPRGFKALSPYEEVMQMLDDFVAGEPIPTKAMKLLHKHEDGVWEFRPVGVRIFGVFVQPNCFVALKAVMKDVTGDDPARYQPSIIRVLRFCRANHLEWERETDVAKLTQI